MERKRTRETNGPDGRIALAGLMLVQVVLGYEWLASGLTKLVRGDFPSGLGGELSEKSRGLSGWYRSFLEGAVVPHARAFGYLIEVGELLTGLVLIGGAVAWLVAWKRIGRGGRRAVLLTIAGAAVAGLVMNVSFHLANGSPLPTPAAGDSFDEAVDLDSLMAAFELVLVAVSVGMLVSLKRTTGAPIHQRTERLHSPPSGREMIPVNTHAQSKLSTRVRSALWPFALLILGLAIGAALFAGRGGTASVASTQSRELAALEAKLGQAQRDVTFWKQLTTVFKPAPLHLRSMQDHRLTMLPSGIVLGLHFDNMNLAKAKNLNWIVFGVPGRFTKADQQRVTREFGPGFVHFHDFVHDTHGGKPGAKGFWFVHIGARNFESPFGQVKAGVIDPRMMPTPPAR